MRRRLEISKENSKGIVIADIRSIYYIQAEIEAPGSSPQPEPLPQLQAEIQTWLAVAAWMGEE